jgi:ribosomal protein S18 acetylase RimI-like enzyme
VCEALEGLDLKLELVPAHKRAPKNTFLAYSANQLVGYCGISDGHDAEVCGMVDPAHRRRHIAGGLAYEAGSLVGTTRLVSTARRTMIYGFVIDRALRGQGHGRSMMRAVLGWLRDRGITEVGLEVEPGNVAAVRLYAGFSFQAVTTYRYMRLPV